MALPPFHVLSVWHRGLLTAATVGARAALLGRLIRRRPAPRDAGTGAGGAAPGAESPGPARGGRRRGQDAALLLGGLALAGWGLGGGWLFERWRRPHRARDWPRPLPAPAEVRLLRRPDGSELHVVIHGPPDGPPVILTSGWGADNEEWAYTVRDLAGRYRLIAWDLPGLGRSTPPRDGDWSMGRLAADLEAVLGLAGGRGAVLVGHSLGAMVLLTFCGLFPTALGARVRGLVLAHVTYTNPVLTTARPALTTALQKPLFEPVCHLTAAVPSLVRLLAWLSYLSGSAHRSLAASLFAGTESWQQLEYLARYYLQSSPVAAARYTLAMFDYDATAVLPGIRVPALIVTGDDDRNCTPQTHALMARLIPGAELLTLRPGRHGGILEHYRAFNGALADFIDRLPTSPPAR